MKKIMSLLFFTLAGTASAQDHKGQHGSQNWDGYDAIVDQSGELSHYENDFDLTRSSFLVDASRDLVDALVYATRLAEREQEFALSSDEQEDIRWFADRISNTRHFVDADVVNALRDGAHPAVALRRLRDLDSNFQEILELAAELRYISPELQVALDEVFYVRDQLIRLLSVAY